MKKSTLFICGTVFFTLTILARLTIEVEAQSFVVTPTIVELEVFPGGEKKEEKNWGFDGWDLC